MKKRFKKIYVEITNICNLKCSFCGVNKKNKKEMSVNEFKIVISKIKNYTDYIYLHVKGEALLHSNLDEILSVCDRENIKVNITTNGTLLKNNYDILNNHKSIRQINVSLHCENNYSNYYNDVFEVCKKLSNNIIISYRIWNLNNYELDGNSTKIVDKIINSYNLSREIVDKIINDVSIKIDNNTFVNKDNLFTWPNENNNFNIDGKCYGLDTHIGILSDGTVIPCCLDSNGEINLGNIFEDNLDDILNSNIVNNMILGFKNNKSVCRLCKNCDFRKRFMR